MRRAGNLSDGKAASRDHASAFATEKWDAAVERGMDPVRRLVSFAYSHYTPAQEALKRQFGAAVEYGIDSGAFSAWSRGGITIDLEKYAEHILAHRHLYSAFVASLDVIPGKKARGLNNVTAAEREQAAEQGWENWIELKRLLKPAGITPIHTYHRGEDVKWLKLMDESEYLSLGGTSVLPTKEKIRWLDSIMPYVTDDKGWPIRKLHGFACTAVEVMKRYPWESVDSASWLHASEHGYCYIRLPGGGYAVINFYFEDWKTTPPSKHFSHYDEADRKVIAAYLATRGFALEQMYDVHCESSGINLSYLNRDAVNADFFWDLEDEITREPTRWRRPAGLFRLR